MNTKEIMELSLKLAGLKEVPEDSAIYVDGDNIKKLLFCIDAGVSELLLANQLGYDAVIAHHPAGGTAAINFHHVFKRHVQQMVSAGIPKKAAEEAVERKLHNLEIEAHTRNYSHTVDAARLLKMPYMNIHTPLDEIGRRTMSEHITKRISGNSTVQDVVDFLNELPEFKNAITKIKIRVGKTTNRAGKVAVSHGAGTNGGYEIAATYFKHGVGTVVYIHISPADVERLKTEEKGNIIITGHVASDSIGINPFIKELEKRKILVTTVGIIHG
jgi:putative NIF3 family GTP cyclohydrolase 1 type 2